MRQGRAGRGGAGWGRREESTASHSPHSVVMADLIILTFHPTTDKDTTVTQYRTHTHKNVAMSHTKTLIIVKFFFIPRLCAPCCKPWVAVCCVYHRDGSVPHHDHPSQPPSPNPSGCKLSPTNSLSRSLLKFSNLPWCVAVTRFHCLSPLDQIRPH